MKQHALKIENLNLKMRSADAIVKTLNSFLEDLNFSAGRISQLECRSRDGFIAYSHNYGGLEGVAFMDQQNAEQWLSAFPNASATLEKYAQYDLEVFCEERGLDPKTELTEEQSEAFYKWNSNDTESTVMFGCDLMLTSENSLNVRITVNVKDAPYHRQYDDLITFDVKFKTVRELQQKLKKILKMKKVSSFARAVREGY